MKIYISGKITGDRRYKAKFREVEKKLAAAGHIVLNPATAPEGLRPVDYMRLCFAMMEAADVVLFMQDYQNSRGRPSAYRDNRRKPNADYANPGRNRADWRRGPRAQRNGADAHPGVKSGGVRGVSGHDPVPHGAIGASARPKRQRTGYDH